MDFKNYILNENLIPDCENPTPDYYCTWQTQLYATSDGKPAAQRACINEKNIFGEEYPSGWVRFYEKARRDLYFVMDDSWDVPLNNYEEYYGSLVLNKEKFPSFVDENNPSKSIKNLSDRIKAAGWKGLGGWVCIQESEKLLNGRSFEEYWTERVKWANEGGMDYWKVDWGKHYADCQKRREITELARKYAPNLTVEHAMALGAFPYSDVFRTYDVPAIMSIPMTVEKLTSFLKLEIGDESRCLINSEDEAYIAAALGTAMGIMRHPYKGNFPNGKKDMSFPALHRNLKTKIDEIARGVNWHKIAPAFKSKPEDSLIDSTVLTDCWRFENIEEEIEAWWLKNPRLKDCFDGDMLVKSANAAISRNMPLPKVCPDENGYIPFVVCAKNPNSAVSVATLGRTRGRDYFVPKCRITIEAEKNSDTFGIFGIYKELEITGLENPHSAVFKAQDLIGNTAYDITPFVKTGKDSIIIDGELISRIGTSFASEGDTSEPGMLLKICGR